MPADFAKAQVLELQSGQVHVVTRSDAVCSTSIGGDGGEFSDASATCLSAQGTADVSARTAALSAADVSARARFSIRFTVSEAPEAPAQSFVPLHIRVPNMQWAARLFNNSITGKRAVAQYEASLRLLEVVGGTSRRVIEDISLFNAVHLGNSCFSAAKSPKKIALAAAKCVVNAQQRHDGGGTATLSAVVQAGRVYAIELGVVASANKEATPLQAPSVDSESVFTVNDKPGLKWTEMHVTVGTDPQTVIVPHTHDYQTGRGRGHNIAEAETSLPVTD